MNGMRGLNIKKRLKIKIEEGKNGRGRIRDSYKRMKKGVRLQKREGKEGEGKGREFKERRV